jgi:Lanthionine synthetase C-like protein/HopA1 effector protein family
MRRLTPEDARNYLLYYLASRLYNHFYIYGQATQSNIEDAYIRHIGLSPFVAELSAANSGTGCWEEGWRLHAGKDGIVDVARAGLIVRASYKDGVIAEDRQLKPDTPVRLCLPKEFLGMSPGFYMVVGNRALIVADGQPLVRVYWNLTSEGAISFVEIASDLLNRAGIPFRLKVLNDPLMFRRCDAAVIYVQRNDFCGSAVIFQRIYDQLRGHLKALTPIFTKPLAPGVGLAEDPGSGGSFGQSRCRLVADGAIRAYEQGKKAVDEQLDIVAYRFAEDGLSLSAPFLNAGSIDHYPCLRQYSGPGGVVRIAVTSPPADFGVGTFLSTASELGYRIVKEAVWYRDQCNWLGAESTDRQATARFGRRISALGSDLYNGTSGVALFLAELYAVCGDGEVRRTALGAIEQALVHGESMLADNRLGLYVGALGIAFSAARVGSVLREQEVVERAVRLLWKCTPDSGDDREHDLISGDAGAIVALLALQELLCDEMLTEFAVRLGNRLIDGADRNRDTYSWKSPGLRCRQNLTGLSHGAAGIGYALLELFRATGDCAYRAAAESAFDYERSCFDSEQGNWPDFREGGMRGPRRAPLDYCTYWCHGAPGISLTRIRAYEILREERYKVEASIAVNTTYEMAKTALREGNGNFSLCHGLAGNAEALLDSRRMLDKAEWTRKSQLAFEIAEAGIETSRKRKGVWSCGVSHGETTGLMLGLAGIGYFYLRLYNPAIPSILFVRREDFKAN